MSPAKFEMKGEKYVPKKKAGDKVVKKKLQVGASLDGRGGGWRAYVVECVWNGAICMNGHPRGSEWMIRGVAAIGSLGADMPSSPRALGALGLGRS